MAAVLVSHGRDGHRQSYIDLFEAMLRRQGPVRTIAHWRPTLEERAPVLFLMVEEAFGGYVLACLWRSLRGRRTAGLLFRVQEAATGTSVRLRIKRLALMLLKRLPGVSTLSIVRYAPGSPIARIADDWIDDPQLWDLDNLDPPPTDLGQKVQAAAGGRRVLMALGGQNEEKGFPFFAQAWVDNPALHANWLFVAAGRVSPDCASSAAAFETAGGVLIDRIVSDAELLSLYGVSDGIWSCYAPHYDQASGIFGRAVQFAKPVVVRRGSLIAAQSADLGAAAIPVDYGDSAAVGQQLQSLDSLSPPKAALSAAMRQRSTDLLSRALAGAA